MTSKTHVVFGLTTALLINKYTNVDTYTVISSVCIASLMPDLDTQKSDPSQIFPPISWVIDKCTKHRGATHTIFPFIFLIFYLITNNLLYLFFCIGNLSHLFLDVTTKFLGIKCNSRGEYIILYSLWIGSFLIFLSMVI